MDDLWVSYFPGSVRGGGGPREPAFERGGEAFQEMLGGCDEFEEMLGSVAGGAACRFAPSPWAGGADPSALVLGVEFGGDSGGEEGDPEDGEGSPRGPEDGGGEDGGGPPGDGEGPPGGGEGPPGDGGGSQGPPEDGGGPEDGEGPPGGPEDAPPGGDGDISAAVVGKAPRGGIMSAVVPRAPRGRHKVRLAAGPGPITEMIVSRPEGAAG